MRRLLVIPLGLLALLVGAMAWSGGGAEGRADFAFINRGDIFTLDPNQMSYLQDIRMAHAMWEGLYTYEPTTLEPIPGCASGHDVSDDKRVYTFHIRPDARWTNGDDVTSRDFVFAWRRMLESPAEYTYLLYYIKGAEQYVKDYADGKRPDFAAVGVEAPDDKTLRVSLNDPVAFLLDLTAFPTFLPLHAASMEPFKTTDAATGRSRYDGKFTRPPALVTNGPYELVRWDFKRRLRLRKNEHYWDRANVRSETIEMVVVEDPLQQLLRYDSGAVDWIASVPTEVAAEMKQEGRPDLRNFGGFGTSFLSFLVRPTLSNGAANPLADQRVRHALGMAIEKRQIVDTITRMGEAPATQYIPPGVFPGYQSPPGHAYDPGRARQLLAEAGYPKDGTLPGVTYLYATETQSSRDLAQYLARQWKQVLNLEIPLEATEGKTRRDRINRREYTIVAANWIGDYGDPSTFTDKYRSTSENNDSLWKSTAYDELVFQATKEPDAEKRLRLLERAESILLAEAPIFPLFHLTNQYLFRDRVKGINLNPRNMTMFKAVYVEK